MCLGETPKDRTMGGWSLEGDLSGPALGGLSVGHLQLYGVGGA